MARPSRGDEIRVGALVLGAIFILVLASINIAGAFSGPQYASHPVRLEYADGIRAGDPVRVDGVKVGSVQGVQLVDGGMVEVRAAVRRSVKLQRDATAAVIAEGVFGAKYLALNPGTGGGVLEGPIVEGEGPSDGFNAVFDLLERVEPKLDDLMTEARRFLEVANERLPETIDRLDAILSEQNQANIDATLGSLRSITDTVEPKVGPTFDNANALLSEAREKMKKLDPLLDQLRSVAAKADSALGEDGERVTLLLDEAHATLAGLQETLGVATDNGGTIESILVETEDLLRDLRVLVRKLEERPDSLIRQPKYSEEKAGGER